MKDDPDLFNNMPIPIQVWGRKLEEEKVLVIMEEVERCAGLLSSSSSAQEEEKWVPLVT